MFHNACRCPYIKKKAITGMGHSYFLSEKHVHLWKRCRLRGEDIVSPEAMVYYIEFHFLSNVLHINSASSP